MSRVLGELRRQLDASRLARLVPESIKRNSGVRLALLPDEVNLVYRCVRDRPEVPRVLVDVGAHVGSTLRSFAMAGWTVYAFEPDAANRAVLERHVAAWPRVRVDPRALSDRKAEGVPFFGSGTSTGVSALAPFEAGHEQHGTVDVTTLDAFCVEHAVTEIGVLKIDVEGFDLNVLRGAPWDRIKPHAIVCEFEDAKTAALGYRFHDMAAFLVERGYSVLVSEWFPVVRYGVAHRWRRLASYPCELVDPRCFGNLIAFRDAGLARRALQIAKPFEPGWRALSALRQAASS